MTKPKKTLKDHLLGINLPYYFVYLDNESLKKQTKKLNKDLERQDGTENNDSPLYSQGDEKDMQTLRQILITKQLQNSEAGN